MLRAFSLFLAASAGALAAQAAYLTSSVRLPAYMTYSRSRFTGIAKARREKRRRRAKK